MNPQVLLQEEARTNINVQEENEYIPDIENKAFGSKEESPGEAPPLYKRILMNFLPLIRALVVVTLFLVNGVGVSPIGCKTQYLFTPKYWYNKQLVIFFIIYFIINLGGYTITKLSDPRRQFILSILGLILYNGLARLGEVWFDKKPWYWPGPLTYFGLAIFPLVMIYVVDDMRRYMIANYSINANRNTIKSIQLFEKALMVIVSLIGIVGFIKAINESKKMHGKNFNFILFLFGAPMALKGAKKAIQQVCTKQLFNKYDREVGYKAISSGTDGIRALMGYFSIVSLMIFSGFLIMNKKEIVKFIKSKTENLKDADKEDLKKIKI